jgi:O-acetyl-ADP-ribose deacetylase (regulator of RNase III)
MISQADMFVNCVNEKFDLKVGFVSNSLLKAAGQELQEDCDSQSPAKEPGDILVTQSYNKLRCNWVCHGFCPRWNDGDEAASSVYLLFIAF